MSEGKKTVCEALIGLITTVLIAFLVVTMFWPVREGTAEVDRFVKPLFNVAIWTFGGWVSLVNFIFSCIEKKRFSLGSLLVALCWGVVIILFFEGIFALELKVITW